MSAQNTKSQRQQPSNQNVNQMLNVRNTQIIQRKLSSAKRELEICPFFLPNIEKVRPTCEDPPQFGHLIMSKVRRQRQMSAPPGGNRVRPQNGISDPPTQECANKQMTPPLIESTNDHKSAKQIRATTTLLENSTLSSLSRRLENRSKNAYPTK